MNIEIFGLNGGYKRWTVEMLVLRYRNYNYKRRWWYRYCLNSKIRYNVTSAMYIRLKLDCLCINYLFLFFLPSRFIYCYTKVHVPTTFR